MRVAICPGSFDPITNGHVDVILRSLKLFDKVVVLVGDNPSKKAAFSAQDRVKMIREVFSSNKNVEVDSFNGLLLEYMKEKKIPVMVRGLRALSDFEYEFQRALLQRDSNKDIETIFIMTAQEHSPISSSMVKEIARFGGDVSRYVPAPVLKGLLKLRASK